MFHWNVWKTKVCSHPTWENQPQQEEGDGNASTRLHLTE